MNFFTCKLRLLQHGLLKEAEELENVGKKWKRLEELGRDEPAVQATADSEDDREDDMDLKEKRIVFTKRAIKKAGGRQNRTEVSGEKVEALSEQRRAVVKQFLGDITKGGACGHCNG